MDIIKLKVKHFIKLFIMGKRIVIKGADFSQVSVSREPLVKIITFGCSRNKWDDLNNTLGTGTKTGYLAPESGTIVSVTIKAEKAGYATVYQVREGNVISTSSLSLASGLNTLGLNINVNKDDRVQIKPDTSKVIKYGGGAGDYPTITETIVDTPPHALPFDFDLVVPLQVQEG